MRNSLAVRIEFKKRMSMHEGKLLKQRLTIVLTFPFEADDQSFLRGSRKVHCKDIASGGWEKRQ